MSSLCFITSQHASLSNTNETSLFSINECVHKTALQGSTTAVLVFGDGQMFFVNFDVFPKRWFNSINKLEPKPLPVPPPTAYVMKNPWCDSQASICFLMSSSDLSQISFPIVQNPRAQLLAASSFPWTKDSGEKRPFNFVDLILSMTLGSRSIKTALGTHFSFLVEWKNSAGSPIVLSASTNVPSGRICSAV